MSRGGCPLTYFYGPAVFDRAPDLAAQTLYVAGGLYGNVFALRAILEMRRLEEEERQTSVALCFNGDFNWLNLYRGDFTEINESVLGEHAIRGNVETELAAPSTPSGCACNYPAYVDDRTIALSDSIFERLHRTAVEQGTLLQRLAQLPMSMIVTMGNHRVGIVHGDPYSLAGWSLAVEAMPPVDEALRRRMGCGPGDRVTSMQRIEEYFRTARVSVFAATHTGLPFMQDFTVDAVERLVVNNGAAGLSNFRDTRYGVLTRLSLDHDPPPRSLYGTRIGGLRCDALPVEYDHAGWRRRFLDAWPAGSPGHTLYRDRIEHGPDFHLRDAARNQRS